MTQLHDDTPTPNPDQPGLKRVLGLPMLVLYGLGVTIGAGIYVLIGVAAGRAGMFAPFSFLLAAFIMVFSAASFAEFSGRYPVSAGESAYVRAGFGSDKMAVLVGLIVIFEATIAAATISLGASGYVQVFVPLPTPVLVVLIIGLMGLIAAAGTLESVGFAALLTLIELTGLGAIIIGGFVHDPALIAHLPEVIPDSFTWSVWSGVFAAGLLAFFAFIGFEDMVNVAEETKDPSRTMPLAIFLSLGLVTVIYFLVTAIAVLNVPIAELAQSPAPLGLVFAAVTPLPPAVITLIAIFATLNGIVIQIIMSSRVIYGLASRGDLPRVLAHINRRTRTPVLATAFVVAGVVVLALSFDLAVLAEFTSRMTLVVFALVNLALVVLKWRGVAPNKGYFTVPVVVPIMGFLLSLMALIPMG